MPDTSQTTLDATDATSFRASGAVTAFLISSAATALFSPSWVTFLVVALIIEIVSLSRIYFKVVANGR